MNEINEIGSDDPNKDDRVVFSKENKDQTILLLGSGALKIGEAGEFDYSGSQAIKAFKEEGYRVVLINPNIATNQTSWGLADAVYFVPVIPSFVERVIEKENPDTIALSFGGQTALNCGLALNDSGVLEKYNIKVLGTPVESIRKTEDRALFNKELQSIGIPVPMSRACNTLEESLKAAELITYPVIIRGAFALGGKGSGRAMNEKELKELAKNAFVESPQILVEEDLTGWKEIEYEVVRDKVDNCITVCNMENVDPLGIHTGESIVIAPSQTLDNEDYQMLRSAALKVIRHMGIIGECNIQYALDPKSRNYRVIEVNARLSRSSALASKATGYPLAFVAAKLGLGYTMPALQNAITKITCADFEPSLDYVAVKVPRWDLQKFRFVSNLVTSEMKSVGEVMALGKTFEEALNKALRMLNIGTQGLFPATFNFPDITNELKRPTPRRIFAVAEALRGEWTPEEISIATGMDMWFLERIAECAACANDLSKTKEITPELLNRAKKDGFSDTAIGKLTETPTEEVRQNRIKNNIVPVIQQIDTLAGEFPTETNYLYMTYHGYKQDINLEGNSNSNKSAIVLGGGPYSIGSSVEFDWCCVQTVHELQKQNYSVTMINSNPETVSTDYDECDTLFFEELSEERVRDIIDYVNPDGVVVSMGGQIPNSLARKLAHHGINILGTDPKNIDCAEDRNKFSSMLDNLEVDQPEWEEFCELDSAISFSEQVGYPVIVRPSYVLSGASMAVVHSKADLEAYIGQSSFINKESPIVISKFEQGAKEIEFDGVAQNGKLLIYAISEHVENAGVHSGDATMVLPPQRVNLETMRMVKRISRNIAGALDISGPFNIQFLAARNKLKVIECNLRASRSFPFVSKVTKQNFIELATQAILDKITSIPELSFMDLDYVGVKASHFSFTRLLGADPTLGVEMASTGEVGCLGDDFHEALLKSMISVGFNIPLNTVLLSTGPLKDKVSFLESAKLLVKMGTTIYATTGTHGFLKDNDIEAEIVYWPEDNHENSIFDILADQKFDLVINIPKNYQEAELTNDYFIRRKAVDFGIPLLTNIELANRLAEAISHKDLADLRIKALQEY